MKQLLIFITLNFWGWQAGYLIFSLLMSIMLISAVWIPMRWHITDHEMRRLTDLTNSALILFIIVQFSQEVSIQQIFHTLQLLPIILYLLLFVQTYNQKNNIRYDALFYIFRKHPTYGAKEVDITYPYLFICLLASSINNIHEHYFYAIIALLIAIALYTNPHRQASNSLFLGLLILVITSGYLFKYQLRQTHEKIAEVAMQWFADNMDSDIDTYKNSTAIGRIGKLKLSDRILFRIEQPYPQPLLLREASYNEYHYGTWKAINEKFHPLKSPSANHWRITPYPHTHSITIYSHLSKGNGVLALPSGSTALHNLPADSASANNFGVVKIKSGPPYINFEVKYGTQIRDELPTHIDLSIPKNLKNTLNNIIHSLNLDDLPITQKVAHIERYFSKYKYTLKNSNGNKIQAIIVFLKETQAGHCEYFATATVLLLRALNIPARYVVGYSAQEYSLLEKKQIIRKRHAHSWVQYYNNNQWINVDTTPSQWLEEEQKNSESWHFLIDLWDWFKFTIVQWRFFSQTSQNNTLIYLLIPLVTLLLFLQIKRKRFRIKQSTRLKRNLLHQLLCTKYNIPFEKHETLRSWLGKADKINQIPQTTLDIITLYYRKTYDSVYFKSIDEENLNKKIKWLKNT